MNQKIAVFLALIGTVILLWNACQNFVRLRKIKTFLSTIKKMEEESKRIIIDEMRKFKSRYSDWSLVILADHYNCSNKIVTALPRLYFKVSETDASYIWKEVYKLIPNDLEYEKIGTLCNGELIKIKMPDETRKIVNDLALCVENARLSNPFSSDNSLYGVINQFVIDYELKARNADNKKLMSDIRNERLELLEDELKLIPVAIN